MNETVTVTVRNGKDVPSAVVGTTMLALKALQNTNMVAFYELVTAARDPQHAMFGNTGHAAQQFGLVTAVRRDGRPEIHEAVRAIIVSAVTGEDFAMTLQAPVSREPDDIACGQADED